MKELLDDAGDVDTFVFVGDGYDGSAHAVSRLPRTRMMIVHVLTL